MPALVLVAVGSMTAACSGSAATNSDAGTDAPDGPCWPMEGTTPRGTVQLGVNEGMFAPMSDELHVVYGPQGGFHMPVHARASAIEPGNPADIYDPRNPRTRFSAYFVDGDRWIKSGGCPVRLGYKPAAGAEYELVYGVDILFDVLLLESEVFDKQVRIELEVIDAAGSYAKVEKVVTTRAPVGWPSSP